jgi:hypothetical protein
MNHSAILTMWIGAISSYNPKLWMKALMKKAAYPSV